MKEIPLRNSDLVALVDDEDYEELSKYKWFVIYNNCMIYAVKSIGYGNRSMHSYLLSKKEGYVRDHKDGNGLNNQKDNLRYATSSQNQFNRKKQNRPTSSKYKGVNFNKSNKNWYVRIAINGKRICLGAFINETNAALAYNEAARKYHGEYAKLNIIVT